jgi:hypothetical protein
MMMAALKTYFAASLEFHTRLAVLTGIVVGIVLFVKFKPEFGPLWPGIRLIMLAGLILGGEQIFEVTAIRSEYVEIASEVLFWLLLFLGQWKIYRIAKTLQRKR